MKRGDMHENAVAMGIQRFIKNFGLMGTGTRCFPYQWVQLQTYESRTLFLMTSLQYYCIRGLAEIDIASQRQNYAQKMQDAQVTKSLSILTSCALC